MQEKFDDAYRTERHGGNIRDRRREPRFVAHGPDQLVSFHFSLHARVHISGHDHDMAATYNIILYLFIVFHVFCQLSERYYAHGLASSL